MIIQCLITLCIAGSVAQPGFEQAALVVSTDGVGFEIPAYDSSTSVLWVTRTDAARLSRFDVSTPSTPRTLDDVDLSHYGGPISSVAVHDGLTAATVIADVSTDPGALVLLDATGAVVAESRTGPHPDMVTFTPDGEMVLVANEGEPNGGIDPDGSVSVFVIERGSDITRVVQSHRVLLGNPLAAGSQPTWRSPLDQTDPRFVEPEYIACTPDSKTAYVVCQENNGVAAIDLVAQPPVVVAQIDLGLLDHAKQSPIDLDRDGWLAPRLQEVYSLAQPDGIAVVPTSDGLRLLTADEGDPRDRWGSDGLADGPGVQRTLPDGGLSKPTIFGSRGISLWTPDGERCTPSVSVAPWFATYAKSWPQHAERIDRRSTKRGAEPEGLAVWSDNGETYAAVGFERAAAIGLFRIGGRSIELIDVMPLQIQNNEFPSPEGLAVLRSADPNEATHIAVADERAGTLTILRVVAR